MSNKWLQREGRTWVEKQIITREQYEEILNLYPETPQRMSQMLPILASVLIGLSLLTFVASNWEVIPQIARLAVLVVTTVGFYFSGYVSYRREHTWVGQGLLGLGVVSFGASMILIGQMFHLVAYDAGVFVLWSLAGLGVLYLYRRTFFLLLLSALLLGGQIYAISSFDQASWFLFGLTVFGLGAMAYQSKHVFVGWILAFLIGIQSILLLVSFDVAWSWVGLVPVALYIIGLSLQERPIAQGFLVWPPLYGFIFAILMVFVHEHAYGEAEFLANPVSYLISFVIMTLLAIWKSGGEKGKWIPLLLFAPFFYFTHGDVMYLIVMFVYSALLIFVGDHEMDQVKSRVGVFLFMLSSFVGYIQLAWDFLDKSLFFLMGGLLLFAIHWILRKRNRWISKGGMRP